MPRAPSSPKSPARQRRNPSNIDPSSSFSTNGDGRSPPLSPQNTSSIPQSPVTPRRSGMDRPARFSGDFTADSQPSGGGLGSLADELANAWDDEGETEEFPSGLPDAEDTASIGHAQPEERNGDAYASTTNESGLDGGAGTSGDDPGAETGKLRLPKHKSKASIHQRHRRHESMYDGSDYGNDSDFDDPGEMPPGLESRMAGLDALVRESEAANDDLIDRVIHTLRDLGGQTGIENNTTRLITAHSSLASHLTHQTRALQTLAHPLLFSPFPTLSPDDIDDLIPIIDDIIPNLPFPLLVDQQKQQTSEATSPSPLQSLQHLLTQTSDLSFTLRALSDTLHESRQLTNTASRRLKSVRELVAEMRREEESREEGKRWIEKGEWDRKLSEREAAKVCGDVVSGFEEFCGEWRAKLFGPEVAVP